MGFGWLPDEIGRGALIVAIGALALSLVTTIKLSPSPAPTVSPIAVASVTEAASPTPTASPSPSASPTQSATPTPTASPSPTQRPTPAPTPCRVPTRWAWISSPANGARVPWKTRLTVTYQCLPESAHLWVVVRVPKAGNRLYPQQWELTAYRRLPDRHSVSMYVWLGMQSETGTPFDILLVNANSSANSTFRWYMTTYQGSYPGMTALPAGATIISGVSVTRTGTAPTVDAAAGTAAAS
jgi:hypothetical protein